MIKRMDDIGRYYQSEIFLIERALKRLKLGIWVYFILLIFEGALRKWILPEFAAPLLIVRDPLALWLIFISLKSGIWKPNAYVLLLLASSILAFVLTLIIGHGNITIALYGFRTIFLHFPIIFIIGCVFSREDVLKLGKVMLWLTIGMTLLVAVQFFSPQSAWVNRGLGGDMEGSGFQGAAGFFRVPGTFSFTTGLSFFYSLAVAYVFYFWLTHRDKISKVLLIISTLALLAAVPLSVSRTVVFQIAVSLAFTLAIIGRKPKLVFRLMAAGIGIIALFSVLNTFSFFQTASFVLVERFENAGRSEGGFEGVFVERFLGGMYRQLTNDQYSLWGAGLGLGTNAGAKIMTGDRAFLVAEEEWGRLIGEMGYILGIIVIFIRGGLVIEFLKKGWNLISKNNILPWMLLSFGIFVILRGEWAQPTALGFGVLIGGLIIAGTKEE